jgi:hypothetical protein
VPRQKHRGGGPRLGPPPLIPRPVDTRTVRERVLIVCEGSTEQLYFDAWRPAGRVYNASCNTLSVVEVAVTVREALRLEGEDFDQVWCVFDHDGIAEQRIRDAFALAAAKGIEIAFSVRSFELWLLLHEELLVSALSNEQLCAKLKEQHGSYTKTDPELFARLRPKTRIAIKNARRLFDDYQPWDPVSSDPSTTVFRLVEQLLVDKR